MACIKKCDEALVQRIVNILDRMQHSLYSHFCGDDAHRTICDSVVITPVNGILFANSCAATMVLRGTVLMAYGYIRTGLACTLALLRRSQEEDRADYR